MNPTKFKKALASGLLIILSFTSCKKDDDSSSNSNNSTQGRIQDHVQNGTWRVSKFIDSGKDETGHFAGYTFTFGSTGSLNAINGTISFDGTWSISDNNVNDDSLGDLDFNIYFNLTNDFEDLNDEWDILSASDGKVELIDVSGGNGGTDYLTFVKN